MNELRIEWDKRKEKANIKNMVFLMMKHVRYFTMKMPYNFLIQTIQRMKTVSSCLA